MKFDTQKTLLLLLHKMPRIDLIRFSFRRGRFLCSLNILTAITTPSYGFSFSKRRIRKEKFFAYLVA